MPYIHWNQLLKNDILLPFSRFIPLWMEYLGVLDSKSDKTINSKASHWAVGTHDHYFSKHLEWAQGAVLKCIFQAKPVRISLHTTIKVYQSICHLCLKILKQWIDCQDLIFCQSFDWIINCFRSSDYIFLILMLSAFQELLNSYDQPLSLSFCTHCCLHCIYFNYRRIFNVAPEKKVLCALYAVWKWTKL